MLLTDRVHVVITDRHGGVSADPYDSRNLGGAVGDTASNVLENRHKTALEHGFDPSRVVLMNQVHGVDVEYVTEPWRAETPAADALCTDQVGLALGVLVADCAPTLIADATAGLVGAAHSGRPGTAAGVVLNLVRSMVSRGADPARMVALVGPAACGACYEVPADVQASFPATGWSTSRHGNPALDIRATITAQLTDHGVADVRHDRRCTIESPELYSYRRDRVTGRFAGYIWLGA
ncbi:laccase [Actinosynnema sp. ALI-1.44]|uniref:peptidoglycan editing factor PgeF n=1 Tax=Actinosynnema sp. ALI-1.44 TaxID=1933779 RepID=UPI00097BE2DF|nr:peptidoglycan editing factor PgeF [Actinosynnema sp. ALI-1.44]ONI74724.1 laccase [Actinosynnema sp. ALI-1.44]